MTTVVRVKRKRHADPPPALLLASKRLKNDEHFKGKSGMADVIQIEENVFRFAATLGTTSKMTDGAMAKVKRAITEHKQINATYRMKPISGVKRTIPTSKVKAEQERYKLIRRENKVAEKPADSSANAKKAAIPVSQSWAEGARNLSCFTPLLDVEEQQSIPKSKSEDIICNSVKMLREKLCFPKPEEEDSDEFIYDLYYCESTQRDWNAKNILYAQPCKDLNFCYEVQDPPKSPYNDDDDSNDEDNWRNDYPDEEDSIDEDERRLVFDEEEDRYESDDLDAVGRDNNDDDDNYASFFTSCDVIERNYDDDIDDLDYCNELDYGDDLDFDSCGDVANERSEYNVEAIDSDQNDDY